MFWKTDRLKWIDLFQNYLLVVYFYYYNISKKVN